MPIIKPEIQKALRAANLLPSEANEEEDLKKQLAESHLSIPEILQDLRQEIDNTEGSTRIRGIELATKLHGLGKNEAPPIPVININIKDPNGPVGINPIFLPRGMTQNG